MYTEYKNKCSLCKYMQHFFTTFKNSAYKKVKTVVFIEFMMEINMFLRKL